MNVIKNILLSKYPFMYMRVRENCISFSFDNMLWVGIFSRFDATVWRLVNRMGKGGGKEGFANTHFKIQNIIFDKCSLKAISIFKLKFK